LIFTIILTAIPFIYVANPACGAEAYTIGIEDELSISVLEQPSLNSTVAVGPDGTITLPQPLGTMNAEGFTRSELEEAIAQKLSPYFVGGVNASVQIAQYNSRKITVLGAVGSPGTKSYSKIPFLMKILADAGGLTANADKTDIKVFSADGVKPTRIINLQQLLTDSHPAWPKLSSNDTLYIPDIPPPAPTESIKQEVPPITPTPEVATPAAAQEQPASKVLLHVLGQVSGNFPFETPPSLPNLLAQVGIPAQPDLLRQIKVIREDGTLWIVNMEKYIATGDANLLPKLQSGDLIYIPQTSLPQLMHVTLLGAVGSPGNVPIDQPTSLLDILAQAGGVSPDADVKQVQITRETQDFIETITVNLQETTLFVQPGDKIWVPRKTSTILRTTFDILRDALIVYGTIRVLTP